MKLPKELTTVTPLSKYLAMIVFIALPIVGFFLGIRYQEMLNLNQQANDDFMSKSPAPTQIIFCTEDIKTCPDGTRVTRQPPTCEFAPCPSIDSDETANWKTYKAPGVYEISYPLDLFSSSSRPDIGGVFKEYSLSWPGIIQIATNDSYYQKTGGFNFRILIAVMDNPKKLSIANPTKLFNEVPYGCSDSFYTTSFQTKELLLDETKALRRDNCSEGLSGVEAHIIIIKDDKIYNIIVEPSGLANQDKKILDQILSTFQFTE